MDAYLVYCSAYMLCSGHVYVAECQTLTLSETGFRQPSIKLDIAQLDVVGIAVLSDRRRGRIASHTTKKGVHLIAFG